MQEEERKTTTPPPLIHLSDFRLPGYPDTPLTLDGRPLCILDTAAWGLDTDDAAATCSAGALRAAITPAIGIATVLYKWHLNALAAFLDLDAWPSVTWTLRLGPEGSTLEIGRIGHQVTFGQLDTAAETWRVMLSFDIAAGDDDDESGATTRPAKGTWRPNTQESMLTTRVLSSPQVIQHLAVSFVAQHLLLARRWATEKGIEHRFAVEYAPGLDVWGDGVPMDPHWLYAPLCLAACTACGRDGGAALCRCARCGTAAYCSARCQRGDWAVHKGVCGMSLEERGQAIRLVERGGLIAWRDESVADDGEEWSRNPCFEVRQRKRRRVGVVNLGGK